MMVNISFCIIEVGNKTFYLNVFNASTFLFLCFVFKISMYSLYCIWTVFSFSLACVRLCIIHCHHSHKSLHFNCHCTNMLELDVNNSKICNLDMSFYQRIHVSVMNANIFSLFNEFLCHLNEIALRVFNILWCKIPVFVFFWLWRSLCRAGFANFTSGQVAESSAVASSLAAGPLRSTVGGGKSSSVSCVVCNRHI